MLEKAQYLKNLLTYNSFIDMIRIRSFLDDILCEMDGVISSFEFPRTNSISNVSLNKYNFSINKFR